MLQPQHTDTHAQAISHEIAQVSWSQQARPVPRADSNPGLGGDSYSLAGLQPLTLGRAEMEKGREMHSEEVLS